MPRAELDAIKLLWEIVNQKTGDLGRVPYSPQKPAFDFGMPEEDPLPRSTPEEEGVDSGHLASLVRCFTETSSLHMHQLLVVRHGHVILETGFDPYPAGLWHASYSMCKSFTGMAVGLLVGEGKLSLEDRVLDKLSPSAGFLSSLRYRELTVRHLLTMSSGSGFGESGAVSGDDWVERFFSSPLKFDPGTRFDYNSMNSYILSALVTKCTGMSLFDYLKERVFTPMGIRRIYWEHTPAGISKGGWGMYIRPEDAAKLGILYLNGGRYRDRQLIPEDWVKESLVPRIETGEANNPWYGYHVWCALRPGSFLYNGMLGQNVHCFPDMDMVVVTNAGNPEIFQNGKMNAVIRTYFGEQYMPEEGPLPPNPASLHRLMRAVRAAEGKETIFPPITRGGWKSARSVERMNSVRTEAAKERFLKSLDGSTYRCSQGQAGLLPLMMQVVHNNYTRGIRSVGFARKGREFLLTVREGEAMHVLPVGFTRGRHVPIFMNGEEYLAGVKGRFGFNEEGIPVLTLVISFIEDAAERRLRIVFPNREHIRLEWSETPGDVLISGLFNNMNPVSGSTSPVIHAVLGRIDPELIVRGMSMTISPVVTADLVHETQASCRDTG